MDCPQISINYQVIQNEVEWFKKVLNLRMEFHAEGKHDGYIFHYCPCPDFPEGESIYKKTIIDQNLNEAERLILILAFIPHLKPDVLDPFLITNQSLGRGFTEFGGISGNTHKGFLPSAETALFLLAGDNIQQRLNCYALFHEESILFKNNILQLEESENLEPIFSSPLLLSMEYREKLISGKNYTPRFSASFPAQKLETQYDWDDLILNESTLSAIQNIITWQRNETTLMQEWQLHKQLKPGYRSLFYGPPGTGKTLTACILSKTMNIPLYRIDLSKVVSKYIGETEKNLAGLFDYAESHPCILFFDEGDALFGARGESNTANDRAANQQIAYLLQRIEAFPNIVILATNLRDNLDEAFSRRFQSEILFDMPDEEARLQLWRDNFTNKPFQLAEDIDLNKLAADYVISGGSIINILRYACLQAVTREHHEITSTDLLVGIKNEIRKEGKIFLSH